MKEYFFWGTDVGDFLIKGINVHTGWGLVATCAFIAVMSFIFEFLRYLQTKHRQRELKIRATQLKMLCSTESAALLLNEATDLKNPLNITLWQRAMLFGAEIGLWMVLQNLGYIIMLTVMIYNGWFLVSAIIGGGIGYFVFGQKFMKINLQNCHIIRNTYCTQICNEADMVKDGESTPALERPSTSGVSTQSCHKSTCNDESSDIVQCEEGCSQTERNSKSHCGNSLKEEDSSCECASASGKVKQSCGSDNTTLVNVHVECHQK